MHKRIPKAGGKASLGRSSGAPRLRAHKRLGARHVEWWPLMVGRRGWRTETAINDHSIVINGDNCYVLANDNNLILIW